VSAVSVRGRLGRRGREWLTRRLWLAVIVRASAKVRAPEFPAGTWLNTIEPLSLRALRGKIVLLDFWTFCCANCLHVIDELHELERDFADSLVIVGVHSPKFEHEKSDAAVRAAAERYRVSHPVFNDPELHLWQQYAVKAWPTLVLIDPDGYVVAQAAGEGQSSGLRRLIEQLIADFDGRLARGASPYRPPEPVDGPLRFPAKAILAGDSVLVADAGHDQLVRLTLDGQTELARYGGGGELAEPNGLAAAPDGLDFAFLVADTGHHRLACYSAAGELVRAVDLDRGLTTITGPVPPVLSPWDVVWWPAAGVFAIAAAGVHLILGWDPVADTVSILAGTTVEGLKDGPGGDGWLAQPSGLAVAGDRLWFVDAETSALRFLTAAGELSTAVGEGLFDFGHVDGPAGQARMQHPLGVAVLADGRIGIADTYNGAVRRYDPATDSVSTLATDLAEPSGLVVTPSGVLVVESAAHRLSRLEPSESAVNGPARRTERPVTAVRPGPLRLSTPFVPPPGRKLDERYGPSTRLTISATPPGLLVAGAGAGTDLERMLVLAGTPGDTGVLHVTAQAASCDSDGEHPACHLARQDWGVPIRLAADGDAELSLMLLG